MSTYKDLGIKPFINAFDTITTMGGSLMPPEVVAAMAEAAGHFVDLFELNEKVGARIAELTRNEGAFITAGAACGLLLCAAAVMTGCDRALIDRLPDTTGMKNEILVHRCQRLGWQRPPRLSGARLVEFGGEEGTRREDLLSAFTERTAAVLYFASPLFERHALPLPEVISLAHERGVPVIVDAAANLPPASNLWAYTGMGADLAIFSGGKGLRGPQSSGLIVSADGADAPHRAADALHIRRRGPALPQPVQGAAGPPGRSERPHRGDTVRPAHCKGLWPRAARYRAV